MDSMRRDDDRRVRRGSRMPPAELLHRRARRRFAVEDDPAVRRDRTEDDHAAPRPKQVISVLTMSVIASEPPVLESNHSCEDEAGQSVRAQVTLAEAGDSLDEQLEEAVRVDVDADLRVRGAVGAVPEIDDRAAAAEVGDELDLDV